ncbi:hypothetical protein [Labrenzia sp. DG1229]|uniref:hypothetical protein n=1 Tax=Labrenzia sp. DG1229 TaxID=681847 RepID=UPI000491AF27|nr:hypothetical protein [Labrenzia sp. DG1229]
MNEETEDNFDPEEPPKDLFFNPWRIPISERSKAIVDEAVRMLENYEKHFKLRRRKRKPRDQDIFEETVSAVLCDVMHQHLLNEQGEPTRVFRRPFGLSYAATAVCSSVA